MFSVHSVFGQKTGVNVGGNAGVSGFELPPVELPVERGADQVAIEKAFARVFSTDDGKLVLSHLQSVTFQRALGPDAPDAQLRYLEGQRAMIATMMRLIRSGRVGSSSINH